LRSSNLSNLILIIISTALALIMVEIGYRFYLVTSMPDRFVSSGTTGDHPSLWYYQHSPYRYSEEFGYEYVPGVHNGGAIDNGKVTKCFSALMNINERGNVARIRGSYEDAEIRVLVFGDSFGVSGRAGPQWPEFLQDYLSERSGRNVHVVNFSRDGYGILQMFDLAASKIIEWKPDVAIFAFITPDLTRGRFWRGKALLDGRERIMTSVIPDSNFSWGTAGDVYLMNSSASDEWCQQALSTQRADDPIVVSLEQTLLIGRQRSSHLANAYSTSQSFVIDLIYRGEPFFSTVAAAPPSIWPQHNLQSFDEDAAMRRNVQQIKSASTHVVLFHLAHYPELKQLHYPELKQLDEFASADERSMSLIDSLVKLTGKPVIGTLEHAKSIGDVNDMVIHPRSDTHPSIEGSRFYADAVATALLHSGELTRIWAQ
jgi:hypothetical protein